MRGLGKPEVALFVERVCGTNPDATLVAALHDATDGNPFFLDEIARLLAAEGSLPRRPDELPLPESVRAVIRRRLTLLPQKTRRALAVASVVGREFESRVLERACGRDSSDLVDCLTPAVTAGVVTRSQGEIGRYAFAHALIRETLYDDLGAADRVDLHCRIGQVLEAVHGHDLGPQLATLAHHFGEAAVARDAEKAIEYVTRAGHRAAEHLAYEEAVRHFERALAFTSFAARRTTPRSSISCWRSVGAGSVRATTAKVEPRSLRRRSARGSLGTPRAPLLPRSIRGCGRLRLSAG